MGIRVINVLIVIQEPQTFLQKRRTEEFLLSN